MFNKKTTSIPAIEKTTKFITGLFSDSMDLEEILSELEKYGCPRIGKYSSGWHCKVEVHITSVGAEFEIASSFKNITPISAAKECLKRLIKAIEDLTIK